MLPNAISHATHRALLGAFAWLLAPFLSQDGTLVFGSIEHAFASMPLMAAPFALSLLSGLAKAEGRSEQDRDRWAQKLQPWAALLVLGSFLLPKGPLAAALTAGWLVMSLLLASTARAPTTNPSLFAARLLLLIGAGWLLASRLGLGPPGLAQLKVFLGALHFHFSGFVLQLFFAATARRLKGTGTRLRVVHQALALLAIAALILIAAGNISGAPVVRSAGVGLMVLSTFGLGTTMTTVASAQTSGTPRRLLLSSCCSLAGAMVLAGIYGIGELRGIVAIELPEMVRWHGLVNALGFALCGLVAHAPLQRASTPSHD